MKKYIGLISLLLVVGLLYPLVVFAAYDYYIPITINNSGAGLTNVSILVTLNNSQLASLGYILPSGLDTDVVEDSASRGYTVVDNKLVFWLPSIAGSQNKTYNYRLGESPAQTSLPVLPGYGGNVTFSDAPDLELGLNFSINITNGFFDTSPSNPLIAFPNYTSYNLSKCETETISHSVGLPTSVSGDLLVLIFQTGNSTTTGTISEASGWTELYKSGTVLRGTYLAYNISDGSLGSSISITTSTYCYSSHEVLLISKGHFTGLPVIAVETEAYTSSPNPPAIAPEWGEAPMVYIAGFGGSNATTTSCTMYENLTTGTGSYDLTYGIGRAAQTFTPSATHNITTVGLRLLREGYPGTVTVEVRTTSGGSETLYENYTAGEDSDIDAECEWWFAQTFTPPVTHNITKVGLKLFKAGDPKTAYVYIRAVDGDHKPTGGNLTSGSFNASAINGTSPGSWHNITVTSYQLTGGTEYAIILAAPNCNCTGPSESVNWRLKNSGSYSGRSWMSMDWGVTFSIDYGAIDFMFEEYGTLVSGPPSDTVLCSGTIDGDTLSDYDWSLWYNITLSSGYQLQAGTKYAIVTYAPNGNATNNLRWLINTSGGYPGGQYCYKPVGGGDWNMTYTGWDLLFGEHSCPTFVSSYPPGYDRGQLPEVAMGPSYAVQVCVAYNTSIISSENPGSYTLSPSTNARAFTIAIKGSEPDTYFVGKDNTFYIYPNSGNIEAGFFSNVTCNVSASIPTGEHNVTFWATGSTYGLDVDGVTKQSKAQGTYDYVPDTSDNWVLNMSYFDSYKQYTVGGGGSETLYENYTAGSSSYALYNNIWLGQSFNSSIPHSISKVGLDLIKSGSPGGNLTVSVRAVDGSGLPTGSDLCGGNITCSSIGGHAFYNITFGSSYSLSANTTYAIVSRALSANVSNNLMWYYISSDAYPRGMTLYSSNNGTSWSSGALADYNFKEYGGGSGGTEVLKLWYEPVTIISGSSLPDRSGCSHTGTINWGSNPSGLGISLGGIQPFSAYTATGSSPEDIVPEVLPDPGSLPMIPEAGATGQGLPLYVNFQRAADSLGWTVPTTYTMAFEIVSIVVGVGAMVATGSVWGWVVGFGSTSALFGQVRDGSGHLIVPLWITILCVMFAISTSYVWRYS